MRASFISRLALTLLASCGGRIDSSSATEGGADSSGDASAVLPSNGDAAPSCPTGMPIVGWFVSGSNAPLYEGGLESTVTCSGEASVFLRSISQASSSDFATMMTTRSATSVPAFAGKRVRFRGWVRTDSLDSWAGLWMRVDRPSNQSGAFDNMANRPIQGTTSWAQYDVVLDVAADAVDVAFGVLVSGNGEAWLDGVDVEVVDDSVPTTGS
jgi:hypothetical protein